MEIPTRYGRVEVRTVGDETLVTAIEVLSPANKRPGVDGADAYEKKRQELYRSTAHLLEIDLLRAGRRPLFARPLPEAPYFIYLSRVQRRPTTDIWPLSLRAPIPGVVQVVDDHHDFCGGIVQRESHRLFIFPTFQPARPVLYLRFPRHRRLSNTRSHSRVGSCGGEVWRGRPPRSYSLPLQSSPPECELV
jgi:hypothetical protein